ncbi:MAG: DDE-type integrase/transposase/recombinase [Gammaproteobacteria bacterium]|nr:DDE-type integrase/transposase/recombinase [Gammaproteobacteria bacterium]
MRRTTNDRTLEKNYVQKWRFLIQEYELVKRHKHPRFKFIGDFYKHHGTNRQTFNKYYNRFRQSGALVDLLPRKRGPKWSSRRPDLEIEEQVIEERKKGLNRYEIHCLLKPKLKGRTPSPSGIYNICRRYQYNRLTQRMKVSKRKIIKERAGELGHADCHYLSKDLIVNDRKRYYLVCVLDSCSRLAWAEVVEDIKSISVMFATLRILNLFKSDYEIQFEEVLTDNGAEFKGGKSLESHPFERLLKELGIKHRHTRPYRPQTNGKVERFWRTLEDELIEGTTFETLEEFKEELIKYLIYYNEHRPHQGIGGKTPKEFKENLSAN